MLAVKIMSYGERGKGLAYYPKVESQSGITNHLDVVSYKINYHKFIAENFRQTKISPNPATIALQKHSAFTHEVKIATSSINFIH